ncbi:unnamed protein product [Vicia faba]|uniref:Uncharacterized protein n=1 Tax=Vicia faba TaxID=3906 RepID=A0AAV0ZKQ0_VICFA|nr:unnamed protein product [Vicia faba]
MNAGLLSGFGLENLLFPKVSNLGVCFNLSLGNLLFTKRPSCPVSALSKAEADSQFEEYGKKISFGGLVPIYDVFKEFQTDPIESPKPDLFIGKIGWYHFADTALYYKGSFWSIVKCVRVESVLKATQNYPDDRDYTSEW